MADTSQELANDTQSWFELGFSRGLTEPALSAGVPKAALVINGVVAFLFIIDFGFWPILIVTLAVHFGSVYVCKGDNQFFECLRAYLNEKDYYGT